MFGRRPHLLVTGSTGLLGSALTREAIDQFQVFGVARRATAVCGANHALDVDLLDLPALDHAVRLASPDVVIHTAAATSVDDCEKDPQMAWRSNVEATNNLLRVLRGHRCRFVLISTDAVFDGSSGDYDERDTPAPINVYGRTKLEAEHATLAARSDTLVVRTAFYGWNVLPKASLGEWILSRLRRGEMVPGFMDIRFSPLLTTHLARLLIRAAVSSAEGVLHLASARGCSKYEFARDLAVAAGFSADRVLRTTLDQATLTAPRPKDVTLSAARATTELDVTLPDVSEGLAEFIAAEPSARDARVDRVS